MSALPPPDPADRQTLAVRLLDAVEALPGGDLFELHLHHNPPCGGWSWSAWTDDAYFESAQDSPTLGAALIAAADQVNG